MKQALKKISVSLVGLLALCGSGFAQTAYKGQLYINNERFNLQGDLLRVQLYVSYNDDILNTGETLNFTPVLKNGRHMKALSSVVVRGTERGKYENRADAFSGRIRNNVAVVTADKRHGTRYFVYDTTIPYSDWMGTAALYVESEERGWGKRPHVYEDKVFSSINISRHAASTPDEKPESNAVARAEWIRFLNPAQAMSTQVEVSGTIKLNDRRHLSRLRGKDFNRAIFEEINTDLMSQLTVPGTTVRNLQIVGYGAPCGDYRTNEIAASERALNLKKYLMNNRLLGSDGLTVTWVAEDWDSIASLVDKSQLKLKSAVLDIIRTVSVVGGREQEIRLLADGAPYSFLKNAIFPDVERVKYTAILDRSGGDTQTTVNGDDSTVSLDNMFITAQGFKVGSREYNDLIDLMARLFPDNAEASIDAAGVALMRGDLSLADSYLRPWKTDPRAYCNMGVLNMLRGDYAKAEVYLQMAEASGVKEATKALGYLIQHKAQDSSDDK